jgi:hypothetical protein
MMMNQAAGYFLPRSVLYAVSRQMAKFVALRLEQ